ncbi:glycosyltransferase family 9 protein [Thermosynechococcus sp. PKX82]|uniref:glycosyltransferase family 9 protein n=1 Tax=Thermosynechococcus sp. PKX82 TaxID=3074086 RepID=UPI002873BE3A|nr:glycosyltransferase family 9 protein [Thermosynechococcus sp. PKX82]WNC29037.1 glycosyltransferase family 9 protein [Thermosynechococcus sp. PKX82]
MKNIVALVPGGIGDQILFFPTLEDLKTHFPNSQIDVVVEPRAVAAYQLSSTVHQVIPFDFKDRNALAEWVNLIGMLRDGEYDAILSLGRSKAVRFLLWLTGIPKRVGFAKLNPLGFLTDAVPVNLDQYSAATYHDLLQAFGITTPCPLPKAVIAEADQQWATAEQQRLGITGRYRLLHGGSSQMALTKGINKIYPPAAWVEVIQTLQQQEPHLPFIVVCGPEDHAWVSALTQALQEIKISRPPDLRKLAALMQQAQQILCTDSGPMHIGVAVGTPLVALFGPTDPAKLLPNDPRFRAVKSPTGNMADIPVSAVIEAARHG